MKVVTQMPDKSVLRQLQSLPLEAKIVLSKQRIKEWYEHFDGNVYVSFSGGKDSTVLAHLVHEMYPEVPLVFSNTGLEYPEVQQQARKWDAEFVRPKMSFSEVITTYGYPIISKEVAEAIYYARRIRGGSTQSQSVLNSLDNGLTERRERERETESYKRTETNGTARQSNRGNRVQDTNADNSCPSRWGGYG